MCGPNEKEVAGGWRRLHNDELYNLYTSLIAIRVKKLRMMRYVEHVSRIGEMRNAYKILVGKPEGKRTFGRASGDGR
jgi:hypothetical protein